MTTRASLAAWSLNDNDTGNQVNSYTSGDASHVQANGQGMDSSFSFHYDISSLIYNRVTTINRKFAVFLSGRWLLLETFSNMIHPFPFETINSLLTKTLMAGNSVNVTRTHISPRTMSNPPASTNVEAAVSRVEHMQIDTAATHGERTFSGLHSTSSNIHMTASTPRTSCSGTRPFYNSGCENTLDQQTSNVTSFVEEMHIDNGSERDTTSPVYGSGSGAVADDEVSNMVVDLETPSVMSTNPETPFTYLAEMSQNWAVMKDTMPFVQGRIKVLTPKLSQS